MTHIHFIGIGGTGLSALARLLLEMGYEVSGSDLVRSSLTDELQGLGLKIAVGHQEENIAGADLVIRSSAIPDDNIEVRCALTRHIPVLKRSEFMGSILSDKTCIAVAGTHGKTTTTAMLTWILSELGEDPSFVVGGVPMNLGVNAHAGKGKVFVIEADEYDHMFLGLKPAIEVVTNIEYDHPDCFPTEVDFFKAFDAFMQLLPPDGTLIACADNETAGNLLSKARAEGKTALPYSLHAPAERNEPASYSAELHVNQSGGYSFEACIREERVKVELQVPGEHNILNALAALTVVHLLGKPLPAASTALARFTGVQRRFEQKGTVNGVVVIDDYAHHPTEIRATLAAARLRHPNNRIIAVWQPHTYSRTQALQQGFISAFKDADEVIVTDIYAAREPKQELSMEKLVSTFSKPARHMPDFTGIIKYLLKSLHPGDVLLVLSAGDANLISTGVLNGMKEASNEL